MQQLGRLSQCEVSLPKTTVCSIRLCFEACNEMEVRHQTRAMKCLEVDKEALRYSKARLQNIDMSKHRQLRKIEEAMGTQTTSAGLLLVGLATCPSCVVRKTYIQLKEKVHLPLNRAG